MISLRDPLYEEPEAPPKRFLDQANVCFLQYSSPKETPVKSLASFADIIPILDAALAAGGARFTLDSNGEAVRWVQRANQARKVKFTLEVERLKGIPGLDPSTPWDTLIICRNENEVEIRVRKPMPRIYDLEGRPIDIGRPQTEVEGEDLLLEARKLAEGLS